MNETFTIDQAAEYLGVKPHMVRNMIKGGKITTLDTGGGITAKKLISRYEIERFLKMEDK